jgi:hypothetical protein
MAGYPVSPTISELFGDNPFVTDPAPGGTGPWGSYKYNPIYFATQHTADVVAKMLGGVVEEAMAITPFGPFKQNQPNLMVRMPILVADTEAASSGHEDNRGYPPEVNGRLLNAGLIANIFGNGNMLASVESLISAEVGFEWHYAPTPPVAQPAKPVSSLELLVGNVGQTVMQADGTFWKRVKDATGK